MAIEVNVIYNLINRVSREADKITKTLDKLEASAKDLDERFSELEKSTGKELPESMKNMQRAIEKQDRAIRTLKNDVGSLNTAFGNFDKNLNRSTGSSRRFRSEADRVGSSLRGLRNDGDSLATVLSQLSDGSTNISNGFRDVSRSSSSSRRELSALGDILRGNTNDFNLLTRAARGFGDTERSISRAFRAVADFSFFKAGVMAALDLFHVLSLLVGLIPLISTSLGGLTQIVGAFGVAIGGAVGSLGRLISGLGLLPGLLSAVGVGMIGMGVLTKSFIQPAVKGEEQLKSLGGQIEKTQNRIDEAKKRAKDAQKQQDIAGYVTARGQAQGMARKRAAGGDPAKAIKDAANAQIDLNNQLQKQQELLDKMPPRWQEIAQAVKDVQAAWRNLWFAQPQGLKISNAILKSSEALVNVLSKPSIMKVAEATANAIERTANAFQRITESEIVRGQFKARFMDAVGIFDQLVDLAQSLGRYINYGLMVTQQFTSEVIKLADGWLKNDENFKAFKETVDKMFNAKTFANTFNTLVKSIGNLISGFQILEQKTGFINAFESAVVETTAAFKGWAEGISSKKGKSVVEGTYKIFKGIRAVLAGMAGGIGAVLGDPQAVDITVQFLEQLGRGFRKLGGYFRDTIKSYGPRLIKFWTALGKLLDGKGKSINNAVGRVTDMITKFIPILDKMMPDKVLEWILTFRLSLFALGLIAGQLLTPFARLAGIFGLFGGGVVGTILNLTLGIDGLTAAMLAFKHKAAGGKVFSKEFLNVLKQKTLIGKATSRLTFGKGVGKAGVGGFPFAPEGMSGYGKATHEAAARYKFGETFRSELLGRGRRVPLLPEHQATVGAIIGAGPYRGAGGRTPAEAMDALANSSKKASGEIRRSQYEIDRLTTKINKAHARIKQLDANAKKQDYYTGKQWRQRAEISKELRRMRGERRTWRGRLTAAMANPHPAAPTPGKTIDEVMAGWKERPTRLQRVGQFAGKVFKPVDIKKVGGAVGRGVGTAARVAPRLAIESTGIPTAARAGRAVGKRGVMAARGAQWGAAAAKAEGGGAISKMLGGVKGAMKGLGGGLKIFKALKSVIGGIFSPIGLIISAFSALSTNFMGVRDRLMETFKIVGGPFIDAFKELFSALGFGKGGKKGGFFGDIMKALDFITNIVGAGLVEAFRVAFAIVTPFLTFLVKNLTVAVNFLNDMWKAIKKLFRGDASGFLDIGKALWTGIKGIWSNIKGLFVTVFKGIFDPILKGILTAMSHLPDWAGGGWAKDKLKSIKNAEAAAKIEADIAAQNEKSINNIIKKYKTKEAIVAKIAENEAAIANLSSGQRSSEYGRSLRDENTKLRAALDAAPKSVTGQGAATATVEEVMNIPGVQAGPNGAIVKWNLKSVRTFVGQMGIIKTEIKSLEDAITKLVNHIRDYPMKNLKTIISGWSLLAKQINDPFKALFGKNGTFYEYLKEAITSANSVLAAAGQSTVSATINGEQVGTAARVGDSRRPPTTAAGGGAASTGNAGRLVNGADLLTQLDDSIEDSARALVNGWTGQLSVSSTLRDYDTVAGAGVSQHTTGMAMDLVPQPWSTEAANRLGRWVQNNAAAYGVNPSQVFYPANDPEHYDHVHVGFGGTGSFADMSNIPEVPNFGSDAAGRIATSLATSVREALIGRGGFGGEGLNITRYAGDHSALDKATPEQARGYAQAVLANWGWGPDQMNPLNQLWNEESGWRWNADNPVSDAYGIPQALPGNRMASAGSDWLTNAGTQIDWGLWYIKRGARTTKSRSGGGYGSPEEALAAKNSTDPRWYGNGGDFIAKRPQLIGVGDKQPERVTISPTRGANKGKYSGGNTTVVHSTINLGTLIANEDGIEQLTEAIGKKFRDDLRTAFRNTNHEEE